MRYDILMKICSLGSGSKGNSLYIETPKTRLLIDAGFSFSELKSRLFSVGVRLQDITAVLVTHEHSDHIAGLTGFCKSGVPVFAHTYTAGILKGRFAGLDVVAVTEAPFDLFDLNIAPFRIPHDAVSHLGYRLTHESTVISVATDVGHVTESLVAHLKESDCIVAEFNHDENMLLKGRYPEHLKRRIIGRYGHLSNTAAAELLSLAVTARTKRVLLAHLSEENNLPELAFDAAVKTLYRSGFVVGRDLVVEVLKQHETSLLSVI
jgi:phosphoribosyl 1,2-cyclic phosphodiesterase